MISLTVFQLELDSNTEYLEAVQLPWPEPSSFESLTALKTGIY